MALPFPPIYLLPTHIPLDSLHELEGSIPTLTYDISEAKVVLGKVTTKQRALFELRSRGLYTEEVLAGKKATDGPTAAAHVKQTDTENEPARKRRRVERVVKHVVISLDSSTESEDDGAGKKGSSPVLRSSQSTQSQDRSSPVAQIMSSPLGQISQESVATSVASQIDIFRGDTVKVVKLAWFTDSLAAGHILSLEPYLVYEGKRIGPPETAAKEPKIIKIIKRTINPEEILSRAKTDAPKTVSTPFSKGAYVKTAQRTQNSQSQGFVTRPTQLLHQTTSEHDDPSSLPEIPAYLHTTYSCQRPTFLTSPNDPFICQLKKIKLARLLTGDEIGVRAYSTSIASLAAYPHKLKSTQEVLHLPGCDLKIATLYEEWKETGHVAIADEVDSNPELQVLNLFYEIWGVGAITAREFYQKGWRDLDDIVEYGWSDLSRVQQIGLKYYDEFQTKIPRAEVESIGNTILAAAKKLHPGCQMVIVGGYRRGKSESGDVDVVLSHPDEAVTSGFVHSVVEELERKQWITHTLKLSMANSERGQTAVSWKGDSGKKGSGFDTLDKALVVWQDPVWPSREADLKENANAKNPNIHRRVDIIISPWKTVGCAVLGWTSGTTFQRDLRRYCKKVRGVKFDSSGIRSMEDGHWVDFESIGGVPQDMLTAEKKVFQGLQLEWREPWERCTG